ncbi:uncharacterized protein MELLADRAFT_62931 [Melampsora larici-populina 98AG31]|uniref:Uncharacterized protein n=1 Tax=Melampsora larici-populina (strain 98AG31 / pathotype 3-4-7) TaxID=747676 RepID=F4RLG1_MELLP|nr:uncharacterized protein MELLADRAFT_62931 [Melampsora larici-populina 98AG31]EGG07000.1 hypothetical protein MELLADRAFT_62931 [Melampsora larici-populina 98AG31]
MQADSDLSVGMNGLVYLSDRTSVRIAGNDLGQRCNVSAVHPFIAGSTSPFSIVTRGEEIFPNGTPVVFTGTAIVTGRPGLLVVNVDGGIMAVNIGLSQFSQDRINLIHVVGRGRVRLRRRVGQNQGLEGWWLLVVSHSVFVDSLGSFVEFEIYYTDNQGYISQLPEASIQSGGIVSLEGAIITFCVPRLRALLAPRIIETDAVQAGGTGKGMDCYEYVAMQPTLLSTNSTSQFRTFTSNCVEWEATTGHLEKGRGTARNRIEMKQFEDESDSHKRQEIDKVNMGAATALIFNDVGGLCSHDGAMSEYDMDWEDAENEVEVLDSRNEVV